MARIPQVTRTITTTEVNVLCLDLTTKTTTSVTVTIPRTYKDDAAILEVAKPAIETDTLKPVHVVSTTVKETLYAMSEDDFIHYAKPMPARGKKNDTEAENN